jgi:hypothetical protein
MKIPLTLPSPARGEDFLIPLPRWEGLGEGDLGANRNHFYYRGGIYTRKSGLTGRSGRTRRNRRPRAALQVLAEP